MTDRGDALLDVIWEAADDFANCEIGTDGIAKAICEHLGITREDVDILRDASYDPPGYVSPGYVFSPGWRGGRSSSNLLEIADKIATLVEAAGL